MLEIFTAETAAELTISLVKFGIGFASKTKLYGDLKRIEDRIREIQSIAYSFGDKVSYAHFHSALISLDNIRMGNDAQMEIRAAIHHLYDAYNTEHDLLDKNLNFDQYLFCNKTAVLISALHLYLSEPEIAEKWRTKATEDYNGAQAIYNNSIEFQKKLSYMLKELVKKEYFDMVKRVIKNTPLSQYRIITEGQYIAFGSQYTFRQDFQVGIGPFKKSLLKAYFLSPKGHKEVLSKLSCAQDLINERNIANMIEDNDQNMFKHDQNKCLI